MCRIFLPQLFCMGYVNKILYWEQENFMGKMNECSINVKKKNTETLSIVCKQCLLKQSQW